MIFVYKVNVMVILILILIWQIQRIRLIMIDKCLNFFLSQNFVPQISAQIGGYADHWNNWINWDERNSKLY